MSTTERHAPLPTATRWMRPLAIASLVSNMVLVVTGGAVRLTGSGLGCPTWPRCTEDSLTPHGELTLHAAIEFGNRMLTFVLVAVAVATFVAAWQTYRPDLLRLATILGLGIPAQAVIGGITVLTHLNPWVVSFHLLTSLAMVGVAVVLVRAVEAPLPPGGRGPVVGLAWATFATSWLVFYVGTVVTGSGPHAGDVDTERNGLSPLQLSQLHADLVFLLLGLTVGLLFVSLASGAAPGRFGGASRAASGTAAGQASGAGTRTAILALLALELAQGTIGFVQYFTDLPEVLVGFHMLGAALISASVTWALLAVRHPRVGRTATP